jgi:two-component system sensor histidine kinase RegB
VLVTGLSNLLLFGWLRRSGPRWLIPAVLLLDVLLLTALLYFTGGPDNPFAVLYVVHVVLAVTVLDARWAWAVVISAAIGYGLLFPYHRPLDLRGLISPHAMQTGMWLSLVLVSGLITYFIGRLTRSLAERDAELTRLREQSARNEQLATLTTLAAGAAHELGTPLGTIAVVAKELELAVERQSQDELLAEDARLIRREVDRCRKILDRMRVDIVRDVNQKVRVVSLNELIELVRQDLPDADRERLQVRCEYDVSAVLAPLRAVQQALGVMIRNAFDASPPEATVTLHVHRGDASKRRALVALEVIDRGEGMPPEIARRAGEPFFTTKSPGKGMGLGLFLVRLVAEKCDGNWRLESEPGQGTRSILELPSADAVGP